MLSHEADILVLAPLGLEIDALCNAFACQQDEPQATADGLTYYPTTISLGGGEQADVCIVQLLRQGVLDAATTTTRLLLACQPWCCVSFGIAGGFIGDNIGIGDVLIAESIIYYEPAKETATVRSQDPGRHGSTRRAQNVETVVESQARTFTVSPRLFAGSLRCVRRLPELTVRHGPLASGEKLIADIDAPSRKIIRQLNRKTLGVDMEAAGVAAGVEALASIRNVELLVIKGISDDASRRKGRRRREDSENRALAARNAARYLRQVLGASESRILVEPKTPRREVSGLRQQIIESIPKFFVHPPKRHELDQVLYPATPRPFVFYHWRNYGARLHWVDASYLQLLRRFHNLGFRICPMVTEGTTDFSESERANINLLTRAMVAASPTWYSEMQRERGTYVEYGAAHGFDGEALKAIRAVRHHLGILKGNLVDEEWLQFIAWRARRVKRCLILVWERHIHIYRQLLGIWGFRPVLLSAKTIMLDGALAKFEAPGCDIYIEPPGYESLWRWVTAGVSDDSLSTLVRYISASTGLRRAMPKTEMEKALREMAPASARSLLMEAARTRRGGVIVSCLLRTLRDWNDVVAVVGKRGK